MWWGNPKRNVTVVLLNKNSLQKFLHSFCREEIDVNCFAEDFRANAVKNFVCDKRRHNGIDSLFQNELFEADPFPLLPETNIEDASHHIMKYLGRKSFATFHEYFFTEQSKCRIEWFQCSATIQDASQNELMLSNEMEKMINKTTELISFSFDTKFIAKQWNEALNYTATLQHDWQEMSDGMNTFLEGYKQNQQSRDQKATQISWKFLGWCVFSLLCSFPVVRCFAFVFMVCVVAQMGGFLSVDGYFAQMGGFLSVDGYYESYAAAVYITLEIGCVLSDMWVKRNGDDDQSSSDETATEEENVSTEEESVSTEAESVSTEAESVSTEEESELMGLGSFEFRQLWNVAEVDEFVDE